MSIAQRLFGNETSIKPFRKYSNGFTSSYSNPPSGYSSSDIKMFPEEIFQNIGGESNSSSSSPVVELSKLVQKYLYTDFAPDINGFCLVTFTPPPFKGLNTDSTYVTDFIKKFTSFAAIDFTPPQLQVESERVTSRNGGLPYATEVTPSEQLSITWIDDINISIYNFHSRWIDYMKHLLDGAIEPPSEYLSYDNDESYGILDYAGRFSIYKLDPGCTTVKFVAECYGVYPLILPNKELIGQRAANELTTFTINYACGYYEETTDTESTLFSNLKG